MDDLLKDAIADAKAVRETALANAKIALEEAFTPRIQSMLSDKIQSELEGDEEEAPVEQEEPEAEEEPEIAVEPEIGEEPVEGEEGEEEFLAAQDEVPAEEEPLVAQDEVPGDEFSEPEEEELEAIEGVIEINGVKYAPVVSEEDEEEAAPEAAPEEESIDDLDLEAILRELEDEVNEQEEEEEVEEAYEEGEVGDGLSSDEAETADEAELAENDVSSDIGGGDNKVADAAADSSDVGQGSEEPASADAPAAGHENSEDEEVDDLVEVNGVTYSKVKEQDEFEARNGDLEVNEEDDIDLEEILKALSEQDDEEEEKAEEQVSKLSSQLGEHRKVVKYLRSKLNEVNLLNAKLLFTNKLFRAYGLTNEQKLKVVENFDRATNLREVKLIFATLAESFGHGPASTVKQPIKEKKGSASKAVASTKPKSTPKVIGEGFDMKERFQKLANIL